MKNRTKTVIAIVFGVVTAMTGLAVTGRAPQTAYAQSSQIAESAATANRNELNVCVSDKTVKIVAYNIDGYNYFRVADLCKALDMKVSFETNPYGQSYIKIISNEPFEGTLENSTVEVKVMIKLNTITVFFDSWSLDANCFNLDGRIYIKLADIVTAANSNNEIKLSSTQKQAEDGVGEYVDTRPTLYDLKADFNSTTNTITLTKTEIDYQKLYEDLYAQYQGKSPTACDKSTPPVPAATAQPRLTSAPEVGTILAKILKDPSKPAYIDNIVGNGDSTHVNWENYTAPYASGLVGECTWYAMGRFEETTGVIYPYSSGIYNLAEVAKNEHLQVIYEPDKIVARSIAVFGGVHVLFVEFIERDEQGNPTYIYFTESNTRHDGIFRPNEDGKVQKLQFSDFINRQSTYKGCIAAK